MANTEYRTYYSTAGNLAININCGRRVTDSNGISKMIDQKVIEFIPEGQTNFGRLITDDPEVISFLDKRMLTQGDVFDAKEYTRRTTPAEIRLKMVEQERDRILEDHNRLLKKLADQQRGAPSK